MPHRLSQLTHCQQSTLTDTFTLQRRFALMTVMVRPCQAAVSPRSLATRSMHNSSLSSCYFRSAEVRYALLLPYITAILGTKYADGLGPPSAINSNRCWMMRSPHRAGPSPRCCSWPVNRITAGWEYAFKYVLKSVLILSRVYFVSPTHSQKDEMLSKLPVSILLRLTRL